MVASRSHLRQALAARYWAIAPKVYPRGVFNFRTIKEAQKAHDNN